MQNTIFIKNIIPPKKTIFKNEIDLLSVLTKNDLNKDMKIKIQCLSCDLLNDDSKKIFYLNLNKDEMGMFCLNWVKISKIINFKINSNLQNKKSSMNVHGDIEKKFLKCFLIILKKNFIDNLI